MGLVAEEADEAQGWLELIEAAQLVTCRDLRRLVIESIELTKIVSASYGTARSNEHFKK